MHRLAQIVKQILQITDVTKIVFMEGKFFLEKELSYRLIGCFYKVRNLYGNGHRELFYDRVLSEILTIEKIPFVEKPKIPLYSMQTGRIISHIIPDKLVAGKIIVELKAKPCVIADDRAQVREYLKITAYEILYLVNFAEAAFQPIRNIYTNDRKPFLPQAV